MIKHLPLKAFYYSFFFLSRYIVALSTTKTPSAPNSSTMQSPSNHTTRQPAVFVAHGGGPMPILYVEEHKEMHKQLAEIAATYPSPKAIIVVSAHWEQKDVTILDNDNPGLYYDYGGFPPQSYSLKYPAQSTPALREAVVSAIEKSGFKVSRNSKRGYDHGVFIPLLLMYPKANIPVIQVSIFSSMDPQKHYALGQALSPLLDEGFLLLGSGSSFHNFWGAKSNNYKASVQFDDELAQLCAQKVPTNERLHRVKNWTQMKSARACHEREEHLVPLFSVLGAAGDKAAHQMKLELLGVRMSNFVFE